ncbi:MAG TPA: M14-type cytosolic carboxypeptidase [Burkholderiaceae bacterium]|jgi:murein tripeptide amidase MpaA|nr:M14-type cytosolic carboxypeptidase [Burkholderiaceae bacterium]
MEVSHNFDSGSIEVIACDGTAADLAIRHDIAANGKASEFLQWFHFRVSDAEQSSTELRIVNAGATTYPDGWRDYRAVASWNRRDWERIPTRYDGQVLTLQLPSAPGPSYISYFEPYSWERHLGLLADCISRGARLRRLGASIQGRDIDALIVGQGARPVWIIARQHPGETMAEWFVDGLLQRLLEHSDQSAELQRQATFYIVPNMNPDGSVLGNLRTNAAGVNLNREWLEPSIECSPEVKCVRDALHATGCDAFFDIHGDESLPYVFVAGCEMLPNFTSKQAAEQDAFAADFRAASSDFQSEHGYHASKYKDDVLKLASKYAGHTFGCLSLTLEMPFKDNANAPDARFGWSAGRSACLGAAMLDPLYRHLMRTGSRA